MNYTSEFYKQLYDFKTKMCNIFKNLDRKNQIIKINIYYDKILLLKKVNLIKPIELWYDYVIMNYSKQIANKDDKFFLDISTENADIDKNYLVFFDQIRSIWEYLNENVKNNIWKYIHVLCILSDKSLNKTNFINSLSN